jgi:hypothetical protein
MKDEDIERINPAGRGQKGSVLQYLLRIGATWRELLTETADDLKELDSPWVCCFAQLPYPIKVEPGTYNVRGQSGNSVIDLDFKIFDLELDEGFQVSTNEINVDITSRRNAVIGTQIRGFVQLWGRRVLYHEKYLSCVTSEGLNDQIINPRGSAWDYASSLYRGKTISASSFEREVAERLRPEMLFAIKRFLINYSVVALRELPPLEILFNYFLMPAPGRVAYGQIPTPTLPAMFRKSAVDHKTVPRIDIERGLQFGLREIDKYLHQLLAMQRLADDGEPELAMIGCVAAIEWYMNSLLPDRTVGWQYPLGKCLKKDPFNGLPSGLKEDLLEVANFRNLLVHGQPPDRAHKNPDKSIEITRALKTGLELYREMNRRRSRSSG